MKHAERQKIDRALTIDAMAKIARAQQRGALSDGLRIIRNPTQIVIESATPTDREWLMKNFPGDLHPHLPAYWHRKGRSKAAIDAHRHVGLLRERVASDPKDAFDHFSWIPRVEVWHIPQPHECTKFKGRVEDGRPQWYCADLGCRKPILISKARELGLLPQPVKVEPVRKKARR